MNKTKIEWADYSWNPIKGACPEACWFCYARAIYRRFKLDPKPWLDIAELNMALNTRRTGKRVFVCSTFELFNPVVDGKWRDYIFDVIDHRRDLTFIILTKRPERIGRPMPPNVWLGVSVTSSKDAWRIVELRRVAAEVRFASFEPILDHSFELDLRFLDWVIVGRLTGRGSRYDPAEDVLDRFVRMARLHRVPLFMKDNLKGIWPGPLIQEWPKEKP